MKILITGASGLLGKRLFEILSKTDETLGICLENKNFNNFQKLDITDKELLESFINKWKPEVIIHTAALVDVDFCEDNKDVARNINCEGTENIVRACKKNNIKLVHISSDYVFDGVAGPYHEESKTNTINFYGSTKLEAEKIVLRELDNSIILRPAILYGNDESTKKSFITQIVEKISNGEKISVDNQVIKYPTLTDDLCFVIKKLIELDARGIYHVSGEEPVTRYQWALKIAKEYGLSSNMIYSDGSPGKAPRPIDIRLLNDKIKRIIPEFNPTGIEKGLKIVKSQKGCMFKMIYSARPDMLVLNQSASLFRINIGKQLAIESPVEADMVIPIPESGIYGATGYSSQSRIPFYFGIIRDYFTNKTLFEPMQETRNAALEKKLIVVEEVVKDKRLVIIDEAILAGTTLAVTIDKLKKAGAKEIHVRIPSPPMTANCDFGILKKDLFLIARKFGTKKEHIEEGLKKFFEVDSLRFLSLEGFLNCVKQVNNSCYECFKQYHSPKKVKISEVPVEIRGGGKYSIKRVFTENLRKNPENIGLYETTIPPRSFVKNHIHAQLDEILIFKTKGKVKTKEGILEFFPGDSLILPPGEFHEIFAEEEEVKLWAIKLPNIPEDKVELETSPHG